MCICDNISDDFETHILYLKMKVGELTRAQILKKSPQSPPAAYAPPPRLRRPGYGPGQRMHIIYLFHA